MARRKQNEEIIDFKDEIKEEIKDEITDELKSTKVDKFFARFVPDNENYFLISVYILADRNKREWVEDYENIMPTKKELRDKFGPGTYRLFALDEKNNLLDTCDFHIKGTINNDKNVSPDRQTIINELKDVIGLIGGNKSESNNDVLIRIMEMNQKSQNDLAKVIADTKAETTKLIMENQKMMFEAMQKINSQKTGIAELAETIEIIDSIRGDGENSVTGKILESLAPAIPGVIQNFIKPEQIKSISAPKQESFDIEKAIALIPIEAQEKITNENKELMIQLLYEHNKTKISNMEARQIIETIIARKPVKKEKKK